MTAQADPKSAAKIQMPQGANRLIIASGGSLILDAGAIFDTSQSATMGIGTISIDIAAARAIASNDIPNTAATPPGGLLTLNSAPLLKRNNAATDKALKIEWAASSSVEIALPTVVYPATLDGTKTVTVKLLAKMTGTTDTPTITVNFFPGVGGTDQGGATAALSNVLQVLSVVVPANGAGAYPSFANIALTPGTHTTDSVDLFAAWVEFSKTITV